MKFATTTIIQLPDVVFGVQLSVVGSGYHLLSLPHTAIILSSGTRPSSHFNTITEPSVVAV